LRKASLVEQQRTVQGHLAARQRAGQEAGAFHALDASLTHTLNAVAALAGNAGSASASASASVAASVATATSDLLRTQVARLRQSFLAVTEALQQVAGAEPKDLQAGDTPVQLQALAKSFHDMALLEVTMQQVAMSGQQVLQRLSRGVVPRESADELGR